MSSPILHIKDSYFFEVPKFMWRSNRLERDDFPDFWVALDEDYLLWEARRFVQGADEEGLDLHGSEEQLLAEYQHWLHADHANAGRPFATFIAQHLESHEHEADLEQNEAVQDAARGISEYRETTPEWVGSRVTFIATSPAPSGNGVL